MNINSLLNRTATVTPKTEGVWTADGGFTEVDGTPTTDKCRVQPLSGREIEEFGRRGFEATHAIYFKPSAVVSRGYTISFADGLEPKGTHVIVGVVNPSQLGIYQKVLINDTQERV